MQAQDEGELFDLYTRAGAPLGRSKPRGQVHRDGDWHRSVHIWIWAVLDGAPHLVLQRRCADKDTWPRALDVAVAGHVRAGESIEATLREAEEEIGLVVRRDELAHLGLRRRAQTRPGTIDNELQEIFARVAPADLAALVPSPAELEAIVAVPFPDGAQILCDGGATAGRRLVREGGRVQLVHERLDGAELVPAPDGYYAKAVASMAVVVSGGIPGAWEIG